MATLALAGCASSLPPGWGAVGGNRAGGTVIVGYDKGEFDQENTNLAAAAAVAKRRCQAWGYSDAEAFDQTTRTCVGGKGYLASCAVWQYRLESQCTSGNNGEIRLQPIN